MSGAGRRGSSLVPPVTRTLVKGTHPGNSMPELLLLDGGLVGSRNDARRHARIITAKGIGALVRSICRRFARSGRLPCTIGEQDMSRESESPARRGPAEGIGAVPRETDQLRRSFVREEGVAVVRRTHESRIHDRIRGVPADVPSVAAARETAFSRPRNGLALSRSAALTSTEFFGSQGPRTAFCRMPPSAPRWSCGGEDEVEVVGHRVAEGIVVGIRNIIRTLDIPNSPEVECTAVRDH